MPRTTEKEEFVRRMKELMKQHNCNQKTLCKACGIKESTFSYYMKESDPRMPKGGALANIATELHTTVDYLLGAQPRKMQFNELKVLLADSSMDMTRDQITELSRMLMLAYARQEATANVGSTEMQ